MSSRALALFALALPFVAACGSTPVIPTPIVEACRTNNTASVRFENRSTNTTMDVVWDGSKLTTVAAGQTSDSYTVAAGITHTLLFRVTNSSTWACTPSTPTLVQCGSARYWCPS
jgi:hypothetical protein